LLGFRRDTEIFISAAKIIRQNGYDKLTTRVKNFSIYLILIED
jgi:hypothetical protein